MDPARAIQSTVSLPTGGSQALVLSSTALTGQGNDQYKPQEEVKPTGPIVGGRRRLGDGGSGMGSKVVTKVHYDKDAFHMGYVDFKGGEMRSVGKRKRKRGKKEIDVDIDGDSIWGGMSASERAHAEDRVTDKEKGELRDFQIEKIQELDARAQAKGKKDEEEEDTGVERMMEAKMSHLLPPRVQSSAFEARTKFHGKEERDYQGRPWSHCPGDVKVMDADEPCYLPTRAKFKIKNAHSKGIHTVRFHPKGHLLLTGGLDGVARVWSASDGRLLRSYMGHSAAVRDVSFNTSGDRFISCSFDRYVRLWNTTDGTVFGTYTTRRVPYVGRFYPLDDRYFVVGYSDNKICAWDTETGEISQEYNHHLGPVNTITFTVGGKQMVTTSDDKKILVWEWDIGVPVKYIAEPDMHSMPSVALHPGESWLAGMCLNNEIQVYQADGRYARNRKKTITGFTAAGYACDMSFSNDGRHLAGGDGDGNLVLWDWRTGGVRSRFRACQKGPCAGCEWSPAEPSVVATGGWDGTLSVWT